MKKFCLVLFLLLIIAGSGCNARENTEWLYVEDKAILKGNSIRYSVNLTLPEDCMRTATCEDRQIYEAGDGSYSVITQIYPHTCAEDAIYDMTGFAAHKLAVICTQRFSMPEYRFTWTTQGESGPLVCTGMVLADEDCCYTLQFRVKQDEAKHCTQTKREVFASYGLYFDEGC